MPPSFVLHYNIIADFWQEGQATVPPTDPPETTGYIQTLKPKIALNEWQHDTFGSVFSFVIMAVDWFPLAPADDPNGLGSLILIHETDGYYMQVVEIYPVCSEGEVIGWQCLCKRRYPS